MTQDRKLVVAISSRALFDLDESHRIFETEGKDAYCRYQMEREEEPLPPGVAFSLVRKLLSINATLAGPPLVEVILLSRNSADTGLRIFNSIQHHKLDITRAAFTSGDSPFAYISAFGAHLFLSANAEDVVQALDAGIAAATIISSGSASSASEQQLRIAFDGDAVLFSDESERIYKTRGLAAFTENEKAAAKTPMSGGPFKAFLAALHYIQTQLGPSVRRFAPLWSRRGRLPPMNAWCERCGRGISVSMKRYFSAAWIKAISSGLLAPIFFSTTKKVTASRPADTSLPAMCPMA